MISALMTIINDEARRIWCYRVTALAVTAIVFCGATLYILRLPDLYDAWAQLYINKQTPVAAAAEGVSLRGDSYGSPYVIQKTLLNDQNLTQVIRAIDPAAKSLNGLQMSAATLRMRNNFHITDQGDGFIEFHYQDRDPKRAASVVRLLLDEFIRSNVTRSRSELDRAADFLDEQISAHEVLMRQSQATLNALREQHPAVATLSLAGGPAFPVADSGPVMVEAPMAAAPPARSAADERVATLEAKLAALRADFTEQHPDVVATSRQLSEAKAARALEPPVAAGPARRYVQRMGPRAAPMVSPKVAAEWADAQRSDEALRNKHEQLLARREAARMSQAVYGPDGSGKFQVTRIPTVPLLPIGPNRTLFIQLAGIAALGCGLGAAYLRGAIRGVVVSPREVELACQLPVVGAVSWEPAWVTTPRAQSAIPVRGPKWLQRLRSPAWLELVMRRGSFW
jgi:uncharacterized protein involved in exopolysaccharide biosynthesis